MKKLTILTVAACLLSFNCLFGQLKVNQVIIANGGQFEFSAPYADRATIGYYNPADTSYQVFDTIQVESVQDIAIDGASAYLAAQDSVIKYDIDTYQRTGKIPFPGVGSVSIIDNYLFIGKIYGNNSHLFVYDKNTLAVVDSFPQVDEKPYKPILVNDSVYVGFNEKGTVDQFPPYGVYADSLGKIGVIHLSSMSYSHTVQLDTNGAGVRDLFAKEDTLYAACNESGNLVEYIINGGPPSFTGIEISGITGISGNNLYGNFYGKGVGSFDIPSMQITDTAIIESSYAASTYDYLNDQFYLTTSDYSSYGKGFWYSVAGTAIDSFDVEISPEAIGVDYRSTTNIKESTVEDDNKLLVFPNPATDRLSFKLSEGKNALYQLKIIDLTGKTVKAVSDIKSSVNVSNLDRGMYLIDIKGNGEHYTTKFIKK